MDERQPLLRVVTRAFEAWEPAFDMVVIMNAGTRPRVLRTGFELPRGGSQPPIKRGVEFESSGAAYYAEFDRIQENTRDAHPVEVASR